MAEVNIPVEGADEDQAHIDAMVAKADGTEVEDNADDSRIPDEVDAVINEVQGNEYDAEEYEFDEYDAEEYEIDEDGSEEYVFDEDESEEEIANDAVAEAGLDMDDLQNKLVENGSLDDSDYAALEGVGITRETVDMFIAGQRALGEQMVGRMHDVVGGEETFNDIFAWAVDNLQPSEINAFNETIDNGSEAAVKMALQGLQAKFNADGGNAPNLLQGGRKQDTGDVFRSRNEITKAMSDPRYAKDAAYRADVEAKLLRSSVI
jgi:hypothetical protein